ncbi:MAG: nucleotidyltransferase family protein [Planctomycetota bacterium]
MASAAKSALGALRETLSVESQIVLTVASAANPQERVQRLAALLEQPWDPASLLAQTTKHRLAALLDWHLDRLPAWTTPALEHLRCELRVSCRQSVIHALQLTHELIQLVGLLRDQGIPVLSYKGPVLAGLLYEDVAQRQFWDLDLLVPADRVLDAKAVLIARGYQPERVLDPTREQQHLETDCEYNFDHPTTGVHVELHWDLLDAAPGKPIDQSLLWASPYTVRIAGHCIDTFAPEAQLLALSIHGGEKHRWKRLKWLGDLARLTHLPAFDWTRAFDLVGRGQYLDIVLLGLHLADLLLDAHVPDVARVLIQERPRITAQAILLVGQIFGEENASLPGFRKWRRYMRAYNEDVGTKRAVDPAWWRYLQAVGTPGWRERRRWRLPTVLGFLHYVLRPYMLLREHGVAGLLRRLR